MIIEKNPKAPRNRITLFILVNYNWWLPLRERDCLLQKWHKENNSWLSYIFNYAFENLI